MNIIIWLVTGATGKIGSQVIERLSRKNDAPCPLRPLIQVYGPRIDSTSENNWPSARGKVSRPAADS